MYEDVGQRRKFRALTVATGVVAALALWAIVEYAVGIDLKAPQMQGAPQQDINAVAVLMSSLFAGLVAWGLLALLERFVNPARTVWLVLAVLGGLFSLGAPFSGTAITTGNRIALLCEHILVGIIVIGGLYRTARPGPRQASAPAEAA
ncbi:MAG: DUF6069 family protein [Micromonosporaceae bacterium]